MARFYSTVKLSKNMVETKEGFLICYNVPIMRAGALLYSPEQTPITPGGERTIVTRTIDDIHDPDVIASFEAKPITIGHPEDGTKVNPDNWKELTVGTVQNVRPGTGEDEDKLIADLVVNDREAIEAIIKKKIREVSCAYDLTFYEHVPGLGSQDNIRGNHVAIVQSGRCGSECAIFDNAPNTGKKSMKQKFLSLIGKAFDESMSSDEEIPEKNDDGSTDELDMAGMMASFNDRLSVLEDVVQSRADEADIPEELPPEPAEDEGTAELGSEDRLMAMFEKILEKLDKKDEAVSLDEEKDSTVYDEDTVSRAEILCPGLDKSGDIKDKALKGALKTSDGEAAINKILNGKSYDSADKDLLFVASSEILKSMREKKLNTRSAMDSINTTKQGPMTPSEVNKMNEEYYSKGA